MLASPLDRRDPWGHRPPPLLEPPRWPPQCLTIASSKYRLGFLVQPPTSAGNALTDLHVDLAPSKLVAGFQTRPLQQLGISPPEPRRVGGCTYPSGNLFWCRSIRLAADAFPFQSVAVSPRFSAPDLRRYLAAKFCNGRAFG